MKKALILFSGGLDSRITAKFVEELGFEVHLLNVKLPFSAGCGAPFEEIKKFAEENGFPLHVVDATEGKLFREYMKLVKHPKHGYGTAMNPCQDCKTFIFKQGGKVAEEIGADIICSGEVLGQRPMSQMKKALLQDEEEAGLKGKILRPLSAKLLPETEYEKQGIVNREKLLDINGRQRERQMKLAEKYKITYPSPGGGCLLCEKIYAKRLKALLEYDPEPSFAEIKMLNSGRMFKNNGLIFVGRNHPENEKLKTLAEQLDWFIYENEKIPGPTIIHNNEKDKPLVEKLWKAYSKSDLQERDKYKEFKV